MQQELFKTPTIGTEIEELAIELDPFNQREIEEENAILSSRPQNLADSLPAYDEEEALERLDKILMYNNIYD